MDAFVEGLNSASQVWLAYVFHAAWQSTLVAVVILTFLAAGRRWPSPVRYGLLLVALLKFAMPPLLSIPTGLFTIAGPVVPASVASIARKDIVYAERLTPHLAIEWESKDSLANPDVSNAVSIPPGTVTLPPSRPVLPPPDLPVSSSPYLSWCAWLMLLHLLGVVCVAGWMSFQIHLLSRVIRCGRIVNSGVAHCCLMEMCKCLRVRRIPRLVALGGDCAPAAFGILHPTVILPASLVDAAAPGALHIVIAHELAHFHRKDLWVNWFQLLLLAVWWFNPVYWLLSRNLRQVREDCCDDLLLAHGITSGDGYCGTLLEVAGQLSRRPPLGATLGFSERMHPLGRRLRRLMDPGLSRVPRLSYLAGTILVVFSIFILPGLRDATKVYSASLNRIMGDDRSWTSSSADILDYLANGCVVTGKVVDETTGEPVPGFRVDVGIKEAETNSKGEFWLDGLTRGEYAMMARKNGYYWPVAHIDTGIQRVTHVTLRTKPGGVIVGRVTDRQGNPVPAALVQEDRSRANYIGIVQYALTDQDGNYRIEGLDPDCPVAEVGFSWPSECGFRLKKNNYFPPRQREMRLDYQLDPRIRPPGQPVTQELPNKWTYILPLRTIQGRVLDEVGVPLQGVQVGYGEAVDFKCYCSTQTDDQGRYVLPGVESRSGPLMVQMERKTPEVVRIPASGDAELNFTLKPDPLADVEVVQTKPKHSPFFIGRDVDEFIQTLNQIGQISGTVVDAVTGKPVPEFEVYIRNSKMEIPNNTGCYSSRYPGYGLVFFDPQGTFMVSDLPVRNCLRVIIEAKGYFTAAIDHVLAKSLPEADPTKLVIKLQPSTQSFEGVIREAGTNLVIPDVLVALVDTSENWPEQSNFKDPWELMAFGFKPHAQYALTDDQGRFHFDWLPVTVGDLMLTKDWFVPLKVKDVNLLEPVSLSFVKGAVIRGSVMDSTGQPVKGKEVSVRKFGIDGELILFSDMRKYSTQEGQVVFRNLPAGDYDIALEKAGTREYKKLHLEAGEERVMQLTDGGDQR